MDKRLLILGLLLLIIGIYYSLYLYFSIPTVSEDMNQNDIDKLLLDQQVNKDLTSISVILIGVGFLLMLISFGNLKHKHRNMSQNEDRKD